MTHLRKLLLISTLIVFSFNSLSAEKNNKIEVSYDEFGQVILTSFDSSIEPDASSKLSTQFTKDFFGGGLPSLSTKDEAKLLVEQLILLQGKVNFILNRTPIDQLIDADNVHQQMGSEGYSVCFISELEETASRDFCYLVGGFLLGDISVKDRNEAILSALNLLKKNSRTLKEKLKDEPLAFSKIPTTMAKGVDDDKPKYPIPEDLWEHMEWLERQIEGLCRGGNCRRSGVARPRAKNGRWFVFGYYKHKDGSEDNRFHAAYF